MADERLFIDTEAMIRRLQDIPAMATAFAMDIIMVIWWPGKLPIEPDAERIVEQLNRVFTRRDYTVDLFNEHKADIAKFFVVLPDGRWTPSPEIASLTGDDERA